MFYNYLGSVTGLKGGAPIPDISGLKELQQAMSQMISSGTG
jgi:hypothetical protein